MPVLKVLFERCIIEGYIPKTWREVKVVFIPKAGKATFTVPKDYRPISLTSFLLKTLEKLLDVHIRNKINPQCLSPNQHAYLKGKSVETALHDVVGTVEKSLKQKEYSLAAFLDIEGAFNNVKTSAIRRNLDSLNIDSSLTKLIMSLLSKRHINATLVNAKVRMTASRGTPQGGVISPLLWVLVVNEVLMLLKNSGIKVIAYADDIVLIATGKFLNTISDLLQTALCTLNSWTKRCGLGINPHKTELVLFTNKRTIPEFNTPSIEGIPLKVSNSAKYLGLILDRKLNWKLNVEERIKKASIAFYSCNRIFGKTWGPSPKVILWMYTAIVRPILTYGCLVWWKAAEKTTNLKALTKIQRLGCIGSTSALRTTPTAGLETILNLLPIDLYMKETAAKSALRISQSHYWKNFSTGHSEILKNYLGTNEGSDYIVPHQDFDKPFKCIFPSREDWDKNNVPQISSKSIFTDGSKMDIGTGAGFYSEALEISSSIRLPNSSSVFQAEVLAVTKAAREASMLEIPRDDITIFIDSQAAIKAISTVEIKSKLVKSCREELKVLASQHNVTLCWVPGHRGIVGNEKADEMARKGSELGLEFIEDTIKPPLCDLKSKVTGAILSEANTRWTNLETCEIARKLWPKYDRKRTDTVMQKDRKAVATLVGVLTGHNMLRYHAKKLRLTEEDLCRGCNDEDEHEDITHFLCHCPSLCNLRNKTLGRYHFENIEELSQSSITDLYRFARGTGWLENP